MIDTIVLCGNTVDMQDQSLLSWIFAEKMEPDGPPPEYRELANEQLEWIEGQLRTSKQVPFAYVPYSTIGSLQCSLSLCCRALPNLFDLRARTAQVFGA